MERKNKNFELAQKTSVKSNDFLERHSHSLFTISRPPTASGGDIAAPKVEAEMEYDSKNPSYQNLNFKTIRSDEHFEQIEDPHHLQSDSNQPNIRDVTGKRKYGSDVGLKLKAELLKYKKELKEYNNTTKDLEEKYVKINYELNEMQQKHERFVASRKSISNETETFSECSSSSLGSEYSLERKNTQVFHREHEMPQQLRKKRKPSDEFLMRQINQEVSDCITPKKYSSKRRIENNKENDPPAHESCNQTAAGLKDIFKVLKNVLDTNQKSQAKEVDYQEMQSTISSLQSEQTQFRNIIQDQQTCLRDYQSRCIKAKHIMQTQQIEIEKLNSSNQQLETEITSAIDQLCVKIDSKLRDVSHLPQLMREEQSKSEKMSKENSKLADRLRTMQSESAKLKLKMDELTKRKAITISRLKAAERDLKIFKTYNTSLKQEKRKLTDDLLKLKEQLENVQNSSKRMLARQREQCEKQRREMQKRVFELELKLSRSENSTKSLIQDRDSLIAELQTQLNSLVHNFEVSQKHIRVLRKHIYSTNGGNTQASQRILNASM